MTLKQLYYLLEVNTRQSVTAAAEALDISPAGLSKAVSELEGELGIKIFERSNKGSRLTADGERVLALAREITAKADELLNLSAGEKRTLRLITYSQFSSDLLISTAADLLSASEVELTQKSVSEYGSPIDTITEQLARSEYDAAVISLTPQLCSRLEQRLEIRVLERSRLCAIVSASLELAKRDYLSPEQLRSVFFIPGSDQYFEDEMAAANYASDAKKAAKVRKAVRKNCKLMKQTLTKEQYSKYLSVINATISNKGLDEMVNE